MPEPSAPIEMFGGLPASIFFAAVQTEELVQQAKMMQTALTDHVYLRGEFGPADQFVHLMNVQANLRAILDGLLISWPPEVKGEARTLAQRVEAFIIPSFKAMTRVWRLEAGDLIGIAPIITDLATELAFRVPLISIPTDLGVNRFREDRYQDALRSVKSFLRAQHAKELKDILYTVRGSESFTDGSDSAWDYGILSNLCIGFALSHEIAHIHVRHFDKPSVLLRPEFLSKIADDTLRYEVEADCWSVTSILNAFLFLHLRDGGKSFVEPYLKQGLEAGINPINWVVTIGLRRISDCIDATFVALLLTHGIPRGRTLYTPERPNPVEALEHIQKRWSTVRDYVYALRTSTLPRIYGIRLWNENDDMRRFAYEQVLARFARDLDLIV